MQMRPLVFTLMSLACSLALAGATVYRWTDEQGIVHYSDQPHANAEKLHVNAAQTYKPSTADTANRTCDSGFRKGSPSRA